MNLETFLASVRSYRGPDPEWEGDPLRARPTEADVERVTTFVTRLASLGLRIPVAALDSNGILELYWDSREHYADLSFDANNTVSLFARVRDQPGVKDRFIEHVSDNDLTEEWIRAELSVFAAPV